MSETFHYFGYGSLINADTRPPSLSVETTRLKGWRREWRVTGSVKTADGETQNLCGLSVRPDDKTSILGVLVEEPLANLSALDHRERRYDRVLTPSGSRDVFIYKARPEYAHWGSFESPIALSYIDCVLQGVIRQFGAENIKEFFETTDGWDVPIVNDRSNPIYPRAITLNDDEQGLVDAMLALYKVSWK